MTTSVLTKAPDAKPAAKPAASADAGTPKPGEGTPAAKPGEEPKPGEKTPEEKTPEQIAADELEGAIETTSKSEAGKKAIERALEAERKKFAVPDKYTRPDLGAESRFSDVTLEQLESEARASGLTQDQAAKLITHRHEAISAQADTFLEELKADKTIGGVHFDTTVALAQKGLDWFLESSDDEAETIKAMLGETGYGNHKALVRRFARIGKLLAEDAPSLKTGGTGDSGAKRDPVEVLYGKQ